MGNCQKQCEYCMKHLNRAPSLINKYAIKLNGCEDKYNINVELPNPLLDTLKELKKENPKALRLALVELIISKL